jgi:arginyl-tRNA synthetase
MKFVVETLLREALAALATAEAPLNDINLAVERTRDPEHGHFASNIAMQLAKPLRKSPRDIAALITANLPASALIEKTAIAGPGFINFYLTDAAFHQELLQIKALGKTYGHNTTGGGTKVLLEFVSANPTGPLHVGHGRHAAYGTCVANLLQANGYAVHKEYYVNDAGRQMDILGLSAWLRLLQQTGHDIAFPSGAYRGQYVQDIAAALLQEDPDLADLPAELYANLPADGPEGNADKHLDALISNATNILGPERFRRVVEFTLNNILDDIKDDLGEFGVTYDEWFSEKSLSDNGDVQQALELLARSQVTYEKEGAIWFRATDYADEKDRVVVRDNGRTTYFASDIAYHLNKVNRGFNKLIDIWGSDHHGYVPRVRAGMEAMGQASEKLDVDLVQFVVLYRGSEKVQMSTRSGEFITLRDLRAEVGNDAARLFFVMRSNEQHLEFDLELAKSRSNENPVYYLQYAHARIASVMRELQSKSLSYDEEQGITHLKLLTAPQEKTLLVRLSQFPEMVELAGRQKAPQHIVHYLKEVAQEFHAWYNACLFLEDDSALRNTRLFLAAQTAQVLRNGLDLLGVSAPESM